MGLEARSATLRADGCFDAGTFGRDRLAPVGVTDVVVVAELDTDADDALLEGLARPTERECVVGRVADRGPQPNRSRSAEFDARRASAP